MNNVTATNERQKLLSSIMHRAEEAENDDVIMSLTLLVGDYGLHIKGAERAKYISSIMLSVIKCNETELQKLSEIAMRLTMPA